MEKGISNFITNDKDQIIMNLLYNQVITNEGRLLDLIDY